MQTNVPTPDEWWLQNAYSGECLPAEGVNVQKVELTVSEYSEHEPIPADICLHRYWFAVCAKKL